MLTTTTFIELARIAHGEKYDYSLVNFTGIHERVLVVCPLHGEFTPYAKNHIYGRKNGCKMCARESMSDFHKNQKIEERKANFLLQAELLHKGKFNYSQVVYTNNHTKVTILCPTHGEFEIEPRNHLKPAGCFGCARVITGSKNIKYLELKDIIGDFRKAHGDRYDYSNITMPKVGALKTSDKLPVICKSHGVFLQSLRLPTAGHGCPQCNFMGFSRSSFLNHCFDFDKTVVKVYLLEFQGNNERFYKIGMTTKTVKERFRKKKQRGGYTLKEIFVVSLPPNKAWDTENNIKKMYRSYKYTPDKRFHGETECFNSSLPVQDVLDFMVSK